MKEHTQIVEKADDWTKNHLSKWLSGEFTDDAIAEHQMHERMIAVYDSDPEFWSNHSWWEVFEAAKLPRVI